MFGYNHKAQKGRQMALQSSMHGLSKDVVQAEGDQRLSEIIDGIHFYLKHFGQNWLYVSIARSYYLRCSRSWSKVAMHLEKFLYNPRNNYSLFMVVLEHEIQKFPPRSYYGKQLQALQRLIRQGPSFNFN